MEAMKRKETVRSLSFKDFVPALSGIIGKIALISSFALVWAQALQITAPDFVIKNVRIELLIGSIITLLGAACFQNAAPAGTLAPLIVLVPSMAAFGVHPFILGIFVGVMGIVAVKTGLFLRLIALAGFTCKTSITLVFGISGIWMSAGKLYSYFQERNTVFWVLMLVLTPIYFVLLHYKKNWMAIPVASLTAFVIPLLLGAGYEHSTKVLSLNLDSFYWWNDMWKTGFGFQWSTILRTLPFALFVVLLWSIDTVSIQTVREASYREGEKMEQLNIEQSFLLVSIRNIIGTILGGAQMGSLWRSFLIPLYMVKRPMRSCEIILGIMGIFASLTLVPIQLMSYVPLVWTVLLFGIFMPFTITAFTNMQKEKNAVTNTFILLFSAIGITFSPVLTWIASVIYDKVIYSYRKK